MVEVEVGSEQFGKPAGDDLDYRDEVMAHIFDRGGPAPSTATRSGETKMK